MTEHKPCSTDNRVFERQRCMRFVDLDEFFFGRILLGLVENPLEDRKVTVNFDLSHIFTQYTSHQEAEAAANVYIECSDRIGEEICDVLRDTMGADIQPKKTRLLASDYYAHIMRTRLEFLRIGDSINLPATIDTFEELEKGKFCVTFSTKRLRDCLHKNLEKQMNLTSDLLLKLRKYIPPVGARIDFRKELDLLQQFLDNRQKVTGEVEFQITSKRIPFRHAIMTYNGDMAMPSPGTCGPEDRVLLPIYLEVGGLLDIIHVGICSSPANPNDVDVMYTIRRPSRDNLFSAPYRGLSADERRKLSEVELSVYQRLHQCLQNHYVFLNRPALEMSFAALTS